MKRLLTTIFTLSIFSSVLSQSQVLRTEFIPTDTRQEGITNIIRSRYYFNYKANPLGQFNGMTAYTFIVTAPPSWNDYKTYFHVENVKGEYLVGINDQIVATTTDYATPHEFDISSYLKQGENSVSILVDNVPKSPLNSYQLTDDAQFASCYIYSQYKLSIFDFSSRTEVDERGVTRFNIDIIADNSFNAKETIQVGYDLYSPANKLLDFGVIDQEIPAQGRDTVRISIPMENPSHILWNDKTPQLHCLTLFTKRDGRPHEHIRVNVGIGTTTYKNGVILRNGKEIAMRTTKYNYSNKATLKAELQSLKKQGYNTIIPGYPQPKVFYDTCDKLGLYVIDNANINPEATEKKNPSNDPYYLGEYLERVRSMYFRSQNHPCVIAYALGRKEAGNGYCMYKVYNLLKELEKDRAIICFSYGGEWNSDEIQVKF